MAEYDTPAEEDLERPAADEIQLARKWRQEIATAEKAHKKWQERAGKIERIYTDERDSSTARGRKFNILWSNVETQRPAVYMQTPKVKAVRRYRDRDPLARFASTLIERSVQVCLELYDFDNVMENAVRDRLVVGRGQVWAIYEPTIAGEVLAYETAIVDYVPWSDFLHSVCRTWGENRWVARRFYKTRSELRQWLQEAGFDPERAQSATMDVALEGEKADEGLKDDRRKCQIWEVWDKTSRKVLYVAPGSNEFAILGQKDPPVQFRDFFPCPRPMLSTHGAKSIIPTPDYALYQDQAEELNRTTERIGVLQKALKVVGVYASESKELAQLLEASDNRMIPVDNWAMFAEGGGAKGRIEWFPIEQVAEVLKGLYEIREQAKQTLYEVSGIGDILRGNTDPDETATAQGIKAQWGSLRVRRIQKDVQRFAADVMRLKAEIISEQFRFPSILAMAGVDEELLGKYVPVPPPPELPPELAQNPQAQQMMQQQAQAMKAQATQKFLAETEKLLRDDMARNFRIDVETDSTLEPDQQEEKATAVEFVTAMSAFLEKATPLAMQGPEAAKMVGELLLFAVRRFDKVDSLEQVIEQAVEAAAKPREPQPDPEMLKVQAGIEAKKAELQMKGEAQKQELGMKREMHQLDMSARIQEVQLDGAVAQIEAQQRAQEGEQRLALQEAQGVQKLRQGEQAMTLAERKARFERAQREGGPPQ